MGNDNKMTTISEEQKANQIHNEVMLFLGKELERIHHTSNEQSYNIEKEYEKVKALGARIIEPPAKRPWGAVSMSFYDPDNNMIYFRSFPEK